MKRVGGARTNKGPWKDRVMEVRRKDAEERQKLYEALSPQQKIAKLDKEGHRAERQRKRILSGV